MRDDRQVDASKGSLFEFTLTPDDLGVADFQGEPFRIEDAKLIQRFGKSRVEWLRVAEEGQR